MIEEKIETSGNYFHFVTFLLVIIQTLSSLEMNGSLILESA
jgi:hypothetical protein